MKLTSFFKSLFLLAVFATQCGTRVPYVSAIPKNPSEKPVAEPPILAGFANFGTQSPAVLNPAHYLSVGGEGNGFESVAIPVALRSRGVGRPIDVTGTGLSGPEVLKAVHIYFQILEKLLPFEQIGLSITDQIKIVEEAIVGCDNSIPVALALAYLPQASLIVEREVFLAAESEKIIKAVSCAIAYSSKIRNGIENNIHDVRAATFVDACYIMANSVFLQEYARIFDTNMKDLMKTCFTLWPSWVFARVGAHARRMGSFKTYIVGNVCTLSNYTGRDLEFGQFAPIRLANEEVIAVEELDVRNTRLTSLNLTNIKKIFPNLKKINLSGNLIKHLSARDIALMEGLEVDLSDNPIATIEDHTNPPFGAKIILSNTAPVVHNPIAMKRLREGTAWSQYVTTGVNILMAPVREALRPIAEIAHSPAQFVAAFLAPDMKKSVLAQYWRDFVWLEGGTRVLAPFREKILGITDEFSIVRPWIYYPGHYAAQKVFNRFGVTFTPSQNFLASMALSVSATTADAYLWHTTLGRSIAQTWEGFHEKIASYAPRSVMIGGVAAGIIALGLLKHQHERRKPVTVTVTVCNTMVDLD